MGQNKRYMLERIVEIQKIVLEHKKRGVTQMWIYQHVIYPRFLISESTFKKYMCKNAKRELKELNENHNVKI